MSEHQQTQQSRESKSNFQKQATFPSQIPVSHPASIIQRARINPKSLTPADVLQLQRTIGNRAVGRLLSEIRNSSKVQQEPIQRQEIPEDEKEPLQGMFGKEPEEETCPSCVQRQEKPEEEEPLQGKFETIQRQEPEEEEKLQMKSIVQRQEISEEEDEPLQGKMIEIIQRQEIPEEEPLQTKRENKTGMPDNLKAGVENLSGIDMNDVRVHYNSSKPAEVGALAYTQGTNIHVAPGQERHLPHEAWHVVQQAQGRVRPTFQMKGVAVNDDVELENEADGMGMKALEHTTQPREVLKEQEILQGKFAPCSVAVRNNTPFCHPELTIVQRIIYVGSKEYKTENARYFRRNLMLTLAALDFPEKGNLKMWNLVDEWLKPGSEHHFGNFEEVVAKLYEEKMMEKKMVAGKNMGPLNLGERPDFNTGVERLLALTKGESQARRHVISSSTLGRAIEMAPAENLDILNNWLLRHRLKKQESTTNGSWDMFKARRRIWKYVHNHIGNLWIGPSMPNSAIGFIRGPIQKAVEGISKYMSENDSDTVPLEEIIKQLPKESPWRNEKFAQTWNLVRETLINQLTQKAGDSHQVDGVDAVALMVEWIRNADLDLPKDLPEGYYDQIRSVYGRLRFPTEDLFAEGGALDDFLRLSLTGRSDVKGESVMTMEIEEGSLHEITEVPEQIVGAGRIQNVDGHGMNCLIRALLVAATGRNETESVVEILRIYLREQGVAERDDMLDLAGVAGAILLTYMEAQGLIPASTGLLVYTPSNQNPPIMVLEGHNPIRLWLSDRHFRAIIP